MVLGIVSIFMNCCCCCGFLIAIPAVISGHMALHEIRRSNYGGKGMALAGLWTGYLSLMLPFVLIICYLMFHVLAGILSSLFA